MKAVRLSVEALDTAEDSKVQQVLKLEDEIDAMERDLRKRHIDRLKPGVCNPGSGVFFIDISATLKGLETTQTTSRS